MSTRGVIFVHSSPTAVCPHVEWAISGVLGARVSLEWTAQPAAPGLLRAECTWSGPAGSAGALAGALRAWPMLRFEVTEEPSPGVDGERRVTGLLRSAGDDGIDVELAADSHRSIRYDEIERARTVFEWGPSPRPGKSGASKQTRKKKKAASK